MEIEGLVAALGGQISVALAGKVDTGKGGGLRTTFGRVLEGTVTVQYPEEKTPVYQRFRGRNIGLTDVLRPKNNAVILWDDAALQAVRLTIPGPTVVSRAIAVLHTSMFDAWVAYDATAVPTVMRRGLSRATRSSPPF